MGFGIVESGVKSGTSRLLRNGKVQVKNPKMRSTALLPISLPPCEMSISQHADAPENALLGTEMRAILSAIYTRVYQPGYEEESVFPVSFRNPQ